MIEDKKIEELLKVSFSQSPSQSLSENKRDAILEIPFRTPLKVKLLKMISLLVGFTLLAFATYKLIKKEMITKPKVEVKSIKKEEKITLKKIPLKNKLVMNKVVNKVETKKRSRIMVLGSEQNIFSKISRRYESLPRELPGSYFSRLAPLSNGVFSQKDLISFIKPEDFQLSKFEFERDLHIESSSAPWNEKHFITRISTDLTTIGKLKLSPNAIEAMRMIVFKTKLMDHIVFEFKLREGHSGQLGEILFQDGAVKIIENRENDFKDSSINQQWILGLIQAQEKHSLEKELNTDLLKKGSEYDPQGLREEFMRKHNHL